MDESLESSFISSAESDEDIEIIPKSNFRRAGGVFDITKFRQTRADKIKEVNVKLIPIVRNLFVNCYVFGVCL